MYSEPPFLAIGAPVLVTLFTGLLIAFAIQLLLTTFGVAAGITALGYLPNVQAASVEPEAEPVSEEKTSSSIAGKIGFAVGASTLLTVNTVLFVACFLAVKLSLVSDVTVGGVLGIVIWSGYFLVLTWLSSKAAGSLLGVVVGAIGSGVQGLIATVTTALGRRKDTVPTAVSKRMADTDATLATIQAQLDTQNRSLEAALQDFVQTLQPPKPDLELIRREVESVLATSGLSSLATTGFQTIDRQALVELVSDRTDFSKQDVDQVVDQLESVWQAVVSPTSAITDFETFLQSANPDTLTPETINARLQQLRAMVKPPESTSEPAPNLSSVYAASMSSLEPAQLFKRLVRTVRDRVDLNDIDVSSILQQLQAFTGSSEGREDAQTIVDPFQNTIRADVEDYLLNAYLWALTRKTVKAEFKDILYDPDANPTAVREQLLPLDRDFFVALLQQRDDLPSAKVDKIVDRLEETRQAVLESLDAAIAAAPSQSFTAQVEDYLRSAVKTDLKPATLQRKVATILQKVDANVQHWGDRLHYLSPDRITALLKERHDLSQKELERVTTHLETVCDRLLDDAQKRQVKIEADAAALWQKLGEYVSDRSQKLTARSIHRQLKTLLKATKTELASLQTHLPPFDGATVEHWLLERQDLSETQVKRTLHQLEKAWNSLLQVPRTVDAAKTGYQQALTVLTDYLQHLDGATITAADLPQDLLHYLKQHHINTDLLGHLSQHDWTPIADLVQQRQDLTEDQRHNLLRQVQRAIYTLGKLPRRLSLRTKRQTQNWQDTLTDYLRHAEPDDLGVDRIPQAVQRLFADAQAAWGTSHQEAGTLGSQKPLFDRTSLITLLKDRGDITEADATRVIEQVEATFKQTSEQAQTLQKQVEDTIATTFDKLRHSIASLPLPELDYDRIKQDLQQVFVDPRAGLESLGSSVGDTLRTQLSTFNRDTLAALIHKRDDLSETLAQQLTDRIDTVRIGAIQQIEAVQQDAQRRLEDLKQQAQRQAEDTRKAIAIAAWWLFATALSSALTAALAGAIAVGGIVWLHQMLGISV